LTPRPLGQLQGCPLDLAQRRVVTDPVADVTPADLHRLIEITTAGAGTVSRVIFCGRNPRRIERV